MIKNVKEYVQMPLLYNHWYVAGTTKEFTNEPKGRILLEHAIVFYRTEAGKLTALQDRCLHRSYPLSASKVINDDIICGYHGARYNANGELINIPCQKTTPDRKLRKYPIKEIGPFVFIWMGEEEADFKRLPNLPHLTEPEYQYIHGSFDINGSYLMMTENLYDLTHFPYLHANTFYFDDSYLDVVRNVKKTNDNLVSLLNVEDNPEGVLKMLPPQLGKALSKTGVLLKTTDETIAPAPGIVKVHQVVWADDKKTAMQGYVLHCMTPVTKTTCLYWYSTGFNYLNDDEGYLKFLEPLLKMAYKEDVDAVEKMQHLLDSDKVDFPEMTIAGDQAGMLFRSVMLNWAKEEYGEDVTSDKNIAVTST